jgi:hypothetical protein
MASAARGRKPGLVLHSEGFEAIISARGLLKKDVATDAGFSASFLADLLAHRGGASRAVAEGLASTIGVKPAALFPELVGWVSPLPDRERKRGES